jgi:hypothetical protein
VRCRPKRRSVSQINITIWVPWRETASLALISELKALAIISSFGDEANKSRMWAIAERLKIARRAESQMLPISKKNAMAFTQSPSLKRQGQT